MSDMLLNEELVEILNKYSDKTNPIGTTLKSMLNNFRRGEMIVPVLGMQGVGKSTLINAVLQENILPNDVDETTCVPVEIKYGENECAEVHFFDSEKIEVLHDREELNNYVDNNYNKANEKGVSRIILYRKNELLQNGLIIVDLPGVGSLTKENENTTKRYIENLCTAIFVFKTVPPITRMERLFIKAVWSQFTDAIFVQNHWGNNVSREIEEGLEWNTTQLKGIANEIGSSFDGEVTLVNAYDGIKGALNHDDDMINSSKIKTLVSKIQQISISWQEEKNKSVRNRVLRSLEITKNQIKKKIEDVSKSEEELWKERKMNYEAFRAGTERIRKAIGSIKRFLLDKQDEVFQFSSKESSRCANRIKARVYQLLDKGLVDGPKLAEAFEMIQEDEFADSMNFISEEMDGIRSELTDKFESLLKDLTDDSPFEFNFYSFDKESNIKFENAIAAVFDIGGAIGGTLGALPLATAILGSNPAGWAVAAIGFGICAIASLTGHGIRKIITNKRINNTKRELDPIIDEIESSLKKNINDNYQEWEGKVQESLQKIIEIRKQEEERLRNSINAQVGSVEKEQLEKDLVFIESEIKKQHNV